MQQPAVDSSQKERQQAVVWLGQDVLLARAQDRFVDNVKIVRLFRDIAMQVRDKGAEQLFNQIMVAELGERGASEARAMHSKELHRYDICCRRMMVISHDVGEAHEQIDTGCRCAKYVEAANLLFAVVLKASCRTDSQR